MIKDARKQTGVHVISLLVANKPGVLVRCAQVFARRAFNIDSLVVSAGANPKYSRMTITLSGSPEMLEQIIKQTSKLVDVIHCYEHTGKDAISREYALFKIKVTASNRAEVMRAIKNRAHIIDESDGAFILGQAGHSLVLDKLERDLKKFGIVELIRSGKLVMATGQEPT